MFVFNHIHPGAWWREQIALPCSVLAAALSMETMLHAVYDSSTQMTLVGEVIRGGGLMLSVLVLVNVSTVLKSYRDASIGSGRLHRLCGELADGTTTAALAVAVFVGVAIFISSFALTVIAPSDARAAARITYSCMAANGLAICAAAAEAIRSFVLARAHVLEHYLSNQ